MAKETEYRIGRTYRLKLEDRYFRVTLMSIDRSVEPPLGHVIIQENTLGSFIGIAPRPRRYAKWGQAIPIADVPLSKLH